MNKLIDAGEGFFLRLLPMWDDKEIYALHFVIEDHEFKDDKEVILSTENAKELRDYLNELLK